MENNTEAQTIAELTSAAISKITLLTPESAPGMVIPDGWNFHCLENTLQNPIRKRGSTNVGSVASFIDLVNAHKEAGTTIYADVDTNANFSATLNGHHAEGAGWGDHKINYSCPLSAEWKAWMKGNGVKMNQEAFALFIENNNLDIRTPSPADMLEISRTLQAKKNADFASAIRLDNGQTQLSYTEEIKGSAGIKGQMQIPETFTIGIPVYVGGAGYAFEARFRYRIESSNLSLWYDIVRPHKVIEAAFSALRTQIEAGTSLKLVDIV